MSLFNVAFSSNEAQILRRDLQSHVVQGGIRQMTHPLNLYVLPVVATKTLMSMHHGKSRAERMYGAKGVRKG